ncbi:MAG TPA: sigma-54 dependent transcriptional regulator [Blastocatellia bacterium]|nr:sigma-54 dependent transcriptional regulator [Blastocatellia bacterium]
MKLIGCSHQHQQILDRLSKMSLTDAEILISGPSGVGKEMYAQYAHQCSPRRHAPFVPVNCGALPPELFENEFFGHVAGAFTGASKYSEGLIAAAEGGTLFLDEVDSLALIAQVKILRFLQEREYRRLGETRLRHADVRIISATNTDLLSAVREGYFREDLFFRLRIIPVEVPSLRRRPSDIPLLIEEYANRFAEAYRLPRVIFSEEAMVRLKTYSWPGNIRELENCLNYLTCSQFGRPVTPAELPLLDVEGDELALEPVPEMSAGEANRRKVDLSPELAKLPYNEAKRGLVDHFEREYLEDALRRSRGNIARAARESHKPRRVFFEMMRKHGLKAAAYHS